MATTSSQPVTGKATTGHGAAGKRDKRRAAGLVATAALGIGLLGGVAFGQVRQETRPAAPPAAVSPAGAPLAARHDRAMYDGSQPGYLELLPGEAPSAADRSTYREDHRAAAPTIDFGPVECGAAPCVSAPAFVPDQFTYRESHGLDGATFVADQFTYREDHRATTAAIVPQSGALPVAWPGYHCGVVLPAAGQVCDQEGLRLGAAAPALVDDGYTPTRLDYREDHQADRRPAAPAPPAVPPCYSGGNAVCGAAMPAAAAGADTPTCIGGACLIP